MITEPPVPQVVSLSENTFDSESDVTTTFQCTATSSTSVDIVWLHDGQDASRLAADHTSRYNTEILGRETEGGITTVTSQLEIESVGVDNNGVVVCEARVPISEALGGPVTATAETTLTVLGEHFCNALHSLVCYFMTIRSFLYILWLLCLGKVAQDV